MTTARAERRARGERGATLIEAAFVVPTLLLLLFGALEFGLFWKDSLGVQSATRNGARAGSAAGDDLTADYEILLSVRKYAAGIDLGSIQYVVIYNSAGPASPDPSATCKAGTPVATASPTADTVGACNVYSGADLRSMQSAWFTDPSNAKYPQTQKWPASSRNQATNINRSDGTAGPDYVGVYIKQRHGWVTKLFGSSTDITDQTVMRIEPHQ